MKDFLTLETVAGKNVRISKKEMIEGGENMTNVVQLADGGFLGVLGVYHQLHCLVSEAATSAGVQHYPRNPSTLTRRLEHHTPRVVLRSLRAQDD